MRNTLIDITWNTYGRLKVIKRDNSIKKITYWICKCKCWNIKSIKWSSIKRWDTKSCGCFHKEKISIWMHRMTWTPEYRAYNWAKNRCQNKNNARYNYYWERWIKFKFNSFKEFYEELWPRPTKKHSIDRINVNWNYELWNVRWANQVEQAWNKRNSLIFKYKWFTWNLNYFSKLLDIPEHTLGSRIRKWMSTYDAFSIPNFNSKSVIVIYFTYRKKTKELLNNL